MKINIRRLFTLGLDKIRGVKQNIPQARPFVPPLPPPAAPDPQFRQPIINPNINSRITTMNKIIIKPVVKSTKSKSKATSLYYVRGKGFVSKTQKGATRFESYDHAEEEIDTLSRAQAMGAKIVDDPLAPKPAAEDPNIVQNEDGKSYAIGFIGAKNIQRDGSISPHKNGLSPRRFRTREEAAQHGSRFLLIEKHAGFTIAETYDRVNSWINKANGKTNPELALVWGCLF